MKNAPTHTISTSQELTELLRGAKKESRGLVVALVNMTPTSAEIMLQRNIDNRKPSPPDIKGYERDMSRRGRWARNGETLKFDRQGNLIDGQKRCMATVHTGHKWTAVVVFNCERHGINASQSLQGGERLSLMGYKFANHNTAHAVAQCLEREENDCFILASTEYKPTEAETDYRVDQDYAVIAAATSVVKRFTSGNMACHAGYGWAYIKLHAVKPKRTEVFFEQLLTGEGIEKNSPITPLRNRLQRDHNRGVGTSAAALSVKQKIYLMLRTFVAWNTTEKVSGSLPALDDSKITNQVYLGLVSKLR
jgi:hypothetical protein